MHVRCASQPTALRRVHKVSSKHRNSLKHRSRDKLRSSGLIVHVSVRYYFYMWMVTKTATTTFLLRASVCVLESRRNEFTIVGPLPSAPAHKIRLLLWPTSSSPAGQNTNTYLIREKESVPIHTKSSIAPNCCILSIEIKFVPLICLVCESKTTMQHSRTSSFVSLYHLNFQKSSQKTSTLHTCTRFSLNQLKLFIIMSIDRAINFINGNRSLPI